MLYDIIEATQAHAEFLAQCRYAMFVAMYPNEDFSQKKEQFIALAEAYYRDHDNLSEQLSVIATYDGKPVGCGTALLQQRPPSIKHYRNIFSYILNVYVMPEHRGKQLARKMMEALHERSEQRGAHTVSLHASEMGFPVYTGMGYEKVENYLEMALKLDENQ